MTGRSGLVASAALGGLMLLGTARDLAARSTPSGGAARPVDRVAALRARIDSAASSATRPGFPSPARWCRRSARRRPSRSPIGTAGSSCRPCRPARTWCARTSAATSRPARRSSKCARARRRPRRSPFGAPALRHCWRRRLAPRPSAPPAPAVEPAENRAFAGRGDDDHERNGLAAAPRAPGHPQGSHAARPARGATTHLPTAPAFGSALGSPVRLATNFFDRHAVLRPGQSPDDRLVRHAATAVLGRQPVARHCLHPARRAGRDAGRLDGARRAHPGRYLVVDSRRLVLDPRARAAPIRPRACRTARSATTAAIRWRCAMSATAAATPAPSTASTRSPSLPALALTYGARYARYDYLDNRSLLSPRVEVTVTPAEARPNQRRTVAPCARARRRGVPAARRTGHLAAAAANLLVASRPAGRSRPNAPRTWPLASSATSADRRCRSARSGSTSTISWSRSSAPNMPGPAERQTRPLLRRQRRRRRRPRLQRRVPDDARSAV